MRAVRFGRLGLAVGLGVLAIFGGVLQAYAQVRPKIEVVPNTPHSQGISSVAFSPDGTHVLSGSVDTTVKLWHAATGALLRTFEGHSGAVYSAAFSPDGTRILSGSQDKTLKLWNAATGAVVRTFEGHSDSIQSVAFSPDGTRVLSGSSDRTMKLWDAATGVLVRTFEGHSDGVTSVAFSPDGSSILSGSNDRTMKLWDAATGALVRNFDGYSNLVYSVAFSQDGTWVLGGSNDGTIKLWVTATGALVRILNISPGTIRSVFSPDGTRILTGGRDVALWDVATGGLVRTFKGHSVGVPEVAISVDGSRVLSGGWDSTVKLWDATTGALVHNFGGQSGFFGGHSGLVNSIAVSPDGSRVLSGVYKKVKLWDAATGALVRTFEGHTGVVESVAFSPDGRHVLSGSGLNFDKTARLWDATTGVLIRTFEGHSSVVTSIAFSPDGSRVLSGSIDRTMKLWEATNGALVRTFEGHSGAVTSVAFSPDGSRVLSSGDRTMLWDAATGELLRTFDTHAVGSARFSPDGSRVLSFSPIMGLRTMKLLDVSTGTLVRSFEGRRYWFLSTAFSPDGSHVLSGAVDGTIRLWDVATGAPLRTFVGHFAQITSLAFSPDARRIISGSFDSTIRIWDTATGAQLAALISGRDDQWLAITPKGLFAASGKGAEMLSVVSGLESYSVMQFYDQLYRPDLVQEALKGDPEGKHKNAAYELNLEKILDSGPAPRIEHLDKKTERTGDTIRLAARIIDEGGGIGQRVVWRVNGQTQGRTEPAELKGAQAPSLSAFTLTETFRIDPSKDNIVELTAYNGAGLLATPPFRIKVDKFGATTGERPHMHVLAIGVDKYRMPGFELKYAVKDTLEFSKALKIVGSTLFAKVETTTLTNEQVTESGIAAAFDRIGADAKVGDVLALYLAGHGKSIEGKYYYYPQTLDFKAGQSLETHGIGQDKWQAWLAKVGHVRRSVLFLDTCYAGAATVLVRGNDSAVQTALDQLKHATGQNLIAASRQAAYEGYKEHGVLTYALLEALHKTGGSGSDDTVGVTALADHANKRVPEITQELFHQKQWPIRRLSGIDFPLGIRQPGIIKAAIPKTPTHMLIRAERVREQPAADAPSKRELSPGTMLRVVEERAGWAAVARDGEKLGFVPAEALLKMQ